MNKILIDWGSTNFTAFLVSPKGAVIEKVKKPDEGILTAFQRRSSASDRNAPYSDFLTTSLAGWLTDPEKASPESPIFMCGMVGSKQGWIETEYNETPCSIADIKNNLVYLTSEQKGPLSKHEICIVPGIKKAEIRDGINRFDIARGEEIKALGALAIQGDDSGILSIPGTHCKLITVEQGRIVNFKTMATGDFFSVMGNSPTLKPLFNRESGFDRVSFNDGLALARHGESLLEDFFQVRSHAIVSRRPQANPESFLSGILIGHELRAIKRKSSERYITFVSDEGEKSECYRAAFEKFGLRIKSQISSEDAVRAGLSLLSGPG